MLYAIFLFYKNLAIGIVWVVRQGIRLWQERQAERQAVRQCADAQRAAYLAGDPSWIYAQHPPANPVSSDNGSPRS
ncbi:hypothetical protein [Nocardia mikamii]|uniref:hypothetical protein n=1 Tax=Nocardia mikamii TaxID=508464 RepID=UPI0007A51DDF|nr:hypothetical protein [Nocardia mikamii]